MASSGLEQFYINTARLQSAHRTSPGRTVEQKNLSKCIFKGSSRSVGHCSHDNGREDEPLLSIVASTVCVLDAVCSTAACFDINPRISP